MPRPIRIIKKYANRRLYDTQTSQSITLQDVRDLIGSGEQVQVVEAKTERDITRAVLLQIVADQELLGRPVLSNEFLEGLIRVNSNPMRDLSRRYLEKIMTHLESQQDQVAQAWTRTFQPAGLDEIAQVPLDAMRKFQRRVFSLWSEALAPSLSAESQDQDPPNQSKKS